MKKSIHEANAKTPLDTLNHLKTEILILFRAQTRKTRQHIKECEGLVIGQHAV